ncbi:MAG: acyl-CoA thioester hydrolase/BAAT C-terminal domain-containing protein [Bacteroidota bacterium]
MKKKRKKTILIIAFIALAIAAYFYVDSLLFDGVRPVHIKNKSFKGRLFVKNELKDMPAIVLIGGGEWGDYWAQEFAKADYAGFSLDYMGHEGLPMLLEEIPLEYFQEAIKWLKVRKGIRPNKVVLMGASRNAELSLLIASYFPESVDGVIAYCPSSVSWSNTVHPFNSDLIKPSWTFEGEAIPFVPMQKFKGNESVHIETLEYWMKPLLDSSIAEENAIRIERIKGPILLLSGRDDKVWPASFMSDMMAKRLIDSSFLFDFQNIQYDNAGHLISGHPNQSLQSQQGKMTINGKEYTYNFGGTAAGDQAAKRDAAQRVFNYLSELKNE